MQILQEFPGYTRATLLQEPAAFVERMVKYLLTRNRVQKARNPDA